MTGSTDARHILKNAQTILLIDWATPDTPDALLRAGFTVFGYSPDRYSAIALDTGEDEQLVFRQLDHTPGQVDIVNIYRPEAEHAIIIAKHILPLKATVVWLQPPVTSANTAKLSGELGLAFVEGVDIAVVAKDLK
jgi:predicted CoA-binding protein